MPRNDDWAEPLAAPALAPDVVHVWSARLDRPPAELAQLAATLSPTERARADRYGLPLLRARFIAARGILRAILAAHLGTAPSALGLGTDAHGKPHLSDSSLDFNLAYSDDRALYAVACGRRVGIDIERVDPALADVGVARRLFAPCEAAALESLEPAERSQEFFRMWTLKEAYVKARGEGLGAGVDTFAVPFDVTPLVALMASGRWSRSSQAPVGPQPSPSRASAGVSPAGAGATRWGAPIWPPIPPSLGSAPAKPWRSSITRELRTGIVHGYSEVMVRARFDKDYYRVMEVSPGATEEEIRRAYRRLALRWHPDRNPGNPDAEERFKGISEAYAVLVDANRRREYDAFRTAGRGADFAPNRDELFRDLFADARASAIFEELARELQRMGLRVDRRDFRQTLFGGRTVVTGHVFVLTPFTPLLAAARLIGAALRGAASVPRSGAENASETQASVLSGPIASGASALLSGLGRVARKLLGGGAPGAARLAEGDVVLPLRLTVEEAQRGTRKHVTFRHASGLDEMVVTVPAGVRAGTRLRLKGKGRARGDGGRGDAYLAVEIGE